MNKKEEKKQNKKESRGNNQKKVESRVPYEFGYTPPTITPSFESSSSLITDNEYEIDSEIDQKEENNK